MVYLFLTQYWGLISTFLGGIIYVATHYTWAKSFAKKKAISLMFSAEARAEQLALSLGTEKLAWVISTGYDLIPSIVRVFISKPAFSLIVQKLFDEAVAFAKAHEVVAPVVVTTPTQTIAPASVTGSVSESAINAIVAGLQRFINVPTTPIVAPSLTITSNGNFTADNVTLSGNPIDPQITTP